MKLPRAIHTVKEGSDLKKEELSDLTFVSSFGKRFVLKEEKGTRTSSFSSIGEESIVVDFPFVSIPLGCQWSVLRVFIVYAQD